MAHGKKRFKIMKKKYVRWPPFSALTTAINQTSSTPASAAQENHPPADTSSHSNSSQCTPDQVPVLPAQDGLEVEDGLCPAATPAKPTSQPTSAPANRAEDDANIDTEHGECLTPPESPPIQDLPLDWNYVTLKYVYASPSIYLTRTILIVHYLLHRLQRLELQQSRLIDMYKKERLKNHLLRTKLSALLGGWRSDRFHAALDDLAQE